jgi:hypothetical protein
MMAGIERFLGSYGCRACVWVFLASLGMSYRASSASVLVSFGIAPAVARA